MRKLFLFIISLIFLSTLVKGASLQIDGVEKEVLNVNISINGQETKTDLPIFVLNERTYVPVRFVSESLGFKVIWLQKTFTVEIRGDNKKMWFPIGRDEVNLGAGLVKTPDGVKASLVKIPGHMDSLTYVPVRFVAEYLGQKVEWEQASMTVKIGNEKVENNTVDLIGNRDTTENKDQVDNKENTNTGQLSISNLIATDISGEDTSTPKLFFRFDNMIDFEQRSDNGFVIINVKNALINDMASGEFQSPLKNSPRYSIKNTDKGLEIIFSRTGDEISVYREADKKTLTVTDSYFFKGLQVADHKGSKAYVLKGLGKQEYNKFEFENPKRVAIDFLDSELDGDNYVEYNEAIGFVEKVRMSQFIPDKNYNPNDKIIRVVFDIEEGVKHPDLRFETVDNDLYILPVESLYDYFKLRNTGTERFITIKDYNNPINYKHDTDKNTITATLNKEIPDGVIKYNDSLIKDLIVSNGIMTISLLRNAEVLEVDEKEGKALKISRVKRGNNSDYFILIDPGHGGTDPGGSDLSKTYYEKDVILPVQRSLTKKLMDLGYYVKKTNDTVDSYINVRARAEMANKLRPDIFISLHANTAPSASAKGIEVLYCSEDKNPNKEKGQARIAQIFTEELVRSTGIEAREIKNRPEIVVVGKTNMSAVLIEMGFLTNPRDLALLKDPAYMEKIVEGIISAVERYLTEFR